MTVWVLVNSFHFFMYSLSFDFDMIIKLLCLLGNFATFANWVHNIFFLRNALDIWTRWCQSNNIKRNFQWKNGNLSNAIKRLKFDSWRWLNMNQTLPENFDWFINRTKIEHQSNINRRQSIVKHQSNSIEIYPCLITFGNQTSIFDWVQLVR